MNFFSTFFHTTHNVLALALQSGLCKPDVPQTSANLSEDNPYAISADRL